MANILFRGTTSPTQPVLVAGGSAAKNSPLTLEEGDWNYKALNDDIQTRATSANPSLTGIVNIQYNIRSALAKYNKYVAGLNDTIPAAGCKIGEYIPTGNSQNATLILDVILRSNDQYARAKTTIAIRSETLPVVTATIQTELENNNVLGLTIETWIDASTGKVVLFAVPSGVVTGNISFDVASYERDVYNAFNLATSMIVKDTTGLTQVVATAKKINTGDITAVSFSGNGSGLTSLNATNLSSGTISGARGVAAGSNSVSFIKYNGITKAAGNFDSGTTNPSSANRLNFDGHFYATKFYGDGSNLTSINAGNISSGTLTLARGGTGQTSHLATFNASKISRSALLSSTATVQAGVEYSLFVGGAMNITLPANPNIGDEIIFINGWSNWDNATCTIVRGNPEHSINGLVENMLVDSNAVRKMTFTYVWDTIWVVSAG